MLYLELSKKYIDKFYNGNKEKAIQSKDGILFDDERVKRTFGDGWKSFFEYKEANKEYCYFIKL